jgi:hypothetical protein
MNYKLWIDYSTILQRMLLQELTFKAYEDPVLYDGEYEVSRTQGLIIWNYSPTMLKEGNINPLNRIDFFIKPLPGRMVMSGFSGELYCAVNIETHRDIDMTGSRCRFIAEEIVESHRQAKLNNEFPHVSTLFTYNPVIYEIDDPSPLTYQPYNRGAVLLKLAFLSCNII